VSHAQFSIEKFSKSLIIEISVKKYFTNVKYNDIINVAGNCVETILGVKEKRNL